MVNEQTLELKTFMLNVDEIYIAYITNRFPTNRINTLTYTVGKKYIKIIREHGVFAFVDKSNGDILFPKSWSTPCKKNVRGNIFSELNGMEAITQNHGGATIHPHLKYLR